MGKLDDYKDLDQNIAGLAWSLNLFPGIHTGSSCGGHKEPANDGQWPEGNWYVSFTVDRNDHGWFALEFLAWLVNYDYADQQHHHVCLYPVAKEQYKYSHFHGLGFMLEGKDGEDPQALANLIEGLEMKDYLSPDDEAEWFSDEEDESDDVDELSDGLNDD
jgi:hypothetical protein